MKQATHQVYIATHGKGLYDFTEEVQAWVRGQNAHTGLLTLFCRHTSASLVIQENADPDVAPISRISSRAWSRKTSTCTGTSRKDRTI